MTDNLFIGIVPEEGSTSPFCSGLFKFDPVQGYEGNLLVPFETKVGEHLFELPSQLKRKALYCLIDGSNLGTILWPDFSGGHRIQNFAARIVHLRVRQLLKGIHIGADEKDVWGISIHSPLLARLFNLQAYSTHFSTEPFKIAVETSNSKEKIFESNLGTLTIGISPTFSPEGNSSAPSLGATSYLSLELRKPINPHQALMLVRKFEHFLSLVAFDFIKAEKVFFKIEGSEHDGTTTKNGYELERAKLVEQAKLQIDRHELPINLIDIDFGKAFDRFATFADSIEQTLNWYRIVTAEKVYLEDKFFYSVRMIESLYRVLGLDTEVDTDALEKLSLMEKSLQKDAENSDIILFLQTRIKPIFNKPASLPVVIRDLKLKYKDVLASEILDEKTIARLRGKEAHGSAKRFSTQEYAYMGNSYEIIRYLYVLTVLEQCGFNRTDMLGGAKKSLSLGRYFSPDFVKSVRELLEAAKNNSA
jgi:hypothetical protein